jgi:hypothetical protein
MKKIVFILLVFLIGSQSVVFSQKKKDRDKVKADTVSVDSLEYKLIVLDPGYDAWLASQPPKTFYTKEYYEMKNRLYVQEWNHRYMTFRNNDRYDTYIDYNSSTDYGLELNYKLFYFFRYFEETNRIKLIPFTR